MERFVYGRKMVNFKISGLVPQAQSHMSSRMAGQIIILSYSVRMLESFICRFVPETTCSRIAEFLALPIGPRPMRCAPRACNLSEFVTVANAQCR
jgi:hypothetical protein